MKNNPYTEALRILRDQDAYLKANMPPQVYKMAQPQNALVIDAVRTTAALEELRGEPGSGDYVVIVCDNEEAETKGEQCKVNCVGAWTDWKDRAFSGETVLLALEAAVAEKQKVQAEKASAS